MKLRILPAKFIMTRKIHKRIFITVATVLVVIAFLYFAGPAKDLPFLYRVHYNTVYSLTPCVGKRGTYADESITFDYLAPFGFMDYPDLPATEGMFATGRWPGLQTEIMDLSDMGIPFEPSNKYKKYPRFKTTAQNSNGAGASWFLWESSPAVSIPNLSEGAILERNEGLSGGEGNYRFLYTAGKEDYFYRIALPAYSGRKGRSGMPSWIYSAAYNAKLWPGELLEGPQYGFWKWFMRPSAEKIEACSERILRRTIRSSDQ